MKILNNWTTKWLQKTPHVQSVPKNEKQIKNLKTKMNNENKLTRDSLYRTACIYWSINLTTIFCIKTTRDLEVIVGNSECLDELSKLLWHNFNFGDFYVSTMAIQHSMFKEKPIIPVAFFVARKKISIIIEEIKNKIPKREKEVSIITDREQGMFDSF